MAKMTLLDMTQDILSDMNSDEVSNITDTVESMQVAQIIKSVYEELINRKNWPHLRTLMQLSASGTTARPTHMSVPDTIKEVVSIHYDKRKSTDIVARYQDVYYLTPDEFLIRTNPRNATLADTDAITDLSGVTLLIKNDKAPEFYTSFDDENIIFDSYDSAVDSTLQASKTQVLAYVIPAFTLTNTFVPDFPAEVFPAFLAEAKSTCFARIKQMPEAKAEQQSKRSMSWNSRKSWQVAGGWRFPDYGRPTSRGTNGRNKY